MCNLKNRLLPVNSYARRTSNLPNPCPSDSRIKFPVPVKHTLLINFGVLSRYMNRYATVRIPQPFSSSALLPLFAFFHKALMRMRPMSTPAPR